MNALTGMNIRKPSLSDGVTHEMLITISLPSIMLVAACFLLPIGIAVYVIVG